jgi:hypothetical protein
MSSFQSLTWIWSKPLADLDFDSFGHNSARHDTLKSQGPVRIDQLFHCSVPIFNDEAHDIVEQHRASNGARRDNVEVKVVTWHYRILQHTST